MRDGTSLPPGRLTSAVNGGNELGQGVEEGVLATIPGTSAGGCNMAAIHSSGGNTHGMPGGWNLNIGHLQSILDRDDAVRHPRSCRDC